MTGRDNVNTLLLFRFLPNIYPKLLRAARLLVTYTSTFGIFKIVIIITTIENSYFKISPSNLLRA